MRKSIFALLVAVAGISLATTPVAAQQKWSTIRIVTQGGFVPWNYTKPDGTLAGFDIELAKNLCARMKVKCTVTTAPFDTMIPGLLEGKYDLIINVLAITPQREELIAFSTPYANLCYTLATMKGSSVAKQVPVSDKVVALGDQTATEAAFEPIRRAVAGKVVGTLMSGTSVKFYETYLSGVASVRQYKSAEERDFDLLAGRVDVIVGAKDSLMRPVNEKESKNSRWNWGRVLAGPCFQGGMLGKGVGVGVRKADQDLKAMLDEAIRAAQASGTLKRMSEATFGMDVTPR